MIPRAPTVPPEQVRVRLGSSRDVPQVAEFYRDWGYRAGVNPGDTLVVAEHDGRVVGVVRLVHEHDHTMLRGMRVTPAHQRSGVGSRMLQLFVQQLDGDCYCVPYSHLLGFYGRVGFEEVEQSQAPPFLVERVREYRAEGLQVTIMRRPG